MRCITEFNRQTQKFRIMNKDYKETKSNAFYTLLAVVKDFTLRNLEFIPLCIALHYWYDAENDYRYWITILAVAICSGISTGYNNR